MVITSITEQLIIFLLDDRKLKIVKRMDFVVVLTVKKVSKLRICRNDYNWQSNLTQILCPVLCSYFNQPSPIETVILTFIVTHALTTYIGGVLQKKENSRERTKNKKSCKFDRNFSVTTVKSVFALIYNRQQFDVTLHDPQH